MNNPSLMEKLTSLAKRRGFIFPGSEIYGGLSGTWDYGPLGVELTRNIKNEFWRRTVQAPAGVGGVGAAAITRPPGWGASGPLGSFFCPALGC